MVKYAPDGTPLYTVHEWAEMRKAERAAEAEKNPAAGSMGKRGGAARANKLSPEQRAEVARNAAAQRWAKAKENPPPKAPECEADRERRREKHRQAALQKYAAIREALRLVQEEGRSPEEACAATGVRASRIEAALHTGNLASGPGVRPSNHRPDVERAVLLVCQLGLSVKEAAAHAGVPRRAVYRALHKKADRGDDMGLYQSAKKRAQINGAARRPRR